VTAETDAPRRSILVGLVGQGVAPSLTPEMHEREALRQGLRYVYKTIDLTGDQLDAPHLRRLLEYAVRLGFDGLNVTHPIKQAMVPHVDEVSSDVEALGALNTIVVTGRRTVGHNTDVFGFAEAFRAELHDVRLDDVVLLGAGGAGTAVAHALSQLGAARLAVVDPDQDRAARLVESVRGLGVGTDASITDRTAVRSAVVGASGVVNATPIGMTAHPGSPMPVDALHPDVWVADIVYRPLLTELLQAARERGCRVLTGAGMAVRQAAAAFELIAGRPADHEAMARDLDAMVAHEVERVPPPPDGPDPGPPRERNR
jgi:shikimate dehydrogenase